jgi:site-specific recombinase
VGLVFRLRQVRTRIVRVRQLLSCLTSAHPEQEAARLLAGFVSVGRDRRSLRHLLATNSSLLAAKVTERSAETGEHYISHNRSEYLQMVRRAAGGGLLMSVTTLLKFGLAALAFSAFWGGFWAGVNYSISFVLIQLLHWTVATKQPAMTAPAMAAKLKDMQSSEDATHTLEAFVDEVANLVRTQVAAILGNVLVVFPAALILSLLWWQMFGATPLDAAHAQSTLDSLHVLGPSALFAAYTGVLLFASSLIAGWVENWFVLRRLDSAIRYNPRFTRWLGKGRAKRWGDFWRANISGFAANISLGMMLGLTPAIAAFFGLGLEVRHVTLSSGQLGVASATFGLGVLALPAFWWALALLPLNGALNVIVSFYLAFRMALRAHNINGVERSRIYAAIRQRLRSKPSSFFLP